MVEWIVLKDLKHFSHPLAFTGNMHYGLFKVAVRLFG